MTSNPDLLLFSIAALVGGFLGKVTKIPGGALLGSTTLVAVAGVGLDLSHTTPMGMLFVTQILMGCMLGQSINRRFWHDFLQIWSPSLLVVGAYTLLSAPFAAVMVWMFDFDALSAVLASTPARMQDMIVLAGSMNADAVTVMLMQLFRQFAIIAMTPFILATFLRDEKKKNPEPAAPAQRFHLPEFCRADAATYLMLLVPSVIGGAIGHMTGHILGALLGAFFALSVSRLVWVRAGEAPFPKSFAFIIQCLAGIFLGSKITPETGPLLIARLAPLVSVCLYVLVGGLAVTWLLSKCYGWHRGLSWMAAAPGRAGDMLAMSQDINLTTKDRLALVCVHTVRQIWFTLLISVAMAFFR